MVQKRARNLGLKFFPVSGDGDGRRSSKVGDDGISVNLDRIFLTASGIFDKIR